jgi:hypothetical protein
VRAARRRDALAQHLQPLLQRLGAVVGPEGLEPPSAIGVEAQQVIVEGEDGVGQPLLRRRWGREPLEAAAESVAEHPEPAAADEAVRGARDRRLPIEQRERILTLAGDADGLATDHCSRTRPAAGQCEGPLIPMHEQRSALRRHCSVESDGDGTRGDG